MQINCKERGKKDFRLIYGTILAFTSRDWGKPPKPPNSSQYPGLYSKLAHAEHNTVNAYNSEAEVHKHALC